MGALGRDVFAMVEQVEVADPSTVDPGSSSTQPPSEITDTRSASNAHVLDIASSQLPPPSSGILNELWDLVLVRNVEPPSTSARLNYLDVVRIIGVFGVFMYHCHGRLDNGGRHSDVDYARMNRAGTVVVLPGLFFASGAAFAESSKRKIQRARAQ